MAKFCIIAPNIWGSSVQNLRHVTVLVPRILRQLLYSCKMCEPLYYKKTDHSFFWWCIKKKCPRSGQKQYYFFGHTFHNTLKHLEKKNFYIWSVFWKVDEMIIVLSFKMGCENLCSGLLSCDIYTLTGGYQYFRGTWTYFLHIHG